MNTFINKIKQLHLDSLTLDFYIKNLMVTSTSQNCGKYIDMVSLYCCDGW